jgi:RNA polymerase sigma-70 factor (ECF subfamily)
VKDRGVNPGNESIPGSTSASFLQQLRRGVPEAWQRLTALYGPLVYTWCRRRGLQPEDAADVMQEVFRAVARNLATFRAEPGGTFRGWLWAITRSKIGDLHRRQHKEPPALGGSDAQQRLMELPAADEPEPAEEGDTSRLLHRALELVRNEFEPRTWEAFWRAAVDGQAPIDIAGDLGLSANAVYVAKSRVLRRLRELLETTSP